MLDTSVMSNSSPFWHNYGGFPQQHPNFQLPFQPAEDGLGQKRKRGYEGDGRSSKRQLTEETARELAQLRLDERTHGACSPYSISETEAEYVEQNNQTSVQHDWGEGTEDDVIYLNVCNTAQADSSFDASSRVTGIEEVEFSSQEEDMGMEEASSGGVYIHPVIRASLPKFGLASFPPCKSSEETKALVLYRSPLFKAPTFDDESEDERSESGVIITQLDDDGIDVTMGGD
eukprot:Colp12_sorted_trinity150504_noHs@29991